MLSQHTSDNDCDELQSDLLSIEVELFSECDWHFDDDGDVGIAEGDGMGKCSDEDSWMLNQREWRDDVLRPQGFGADLSWDQLTPESGCFALVFAVVDRLVADGKVHQELTEVDDREDPEDPLDANVFDHESHEEWTAGCPDRCHQCPPTYLLSSMLGLT